MNKKNRILHDLKMIKNFRMEPNRFQNGVLDVKKTHYISLNLAIEYLGYPAREHFVVL